MANTAHPVRTTISGISLFWAATLGIIATVAIIGGIAIWLTTATSGIRGDATVTRQHNSGNNQIAQNTKLLGEQATILSDQQKIALLAAGVSTQQDRIDLAGLQQNCASDVAAYNADVRSILAQGYLPQGLPTAYPASVCEASK